MTNRIFLYGVPGSGKTTISRLVGNKLGLSIIEADKFKKEAKDGGDKNIFLGEGTCTAYRKYGSLAEENAIKGLLSVRKALAKIVESKIVETGAGFVMEGAFLDPNLLVKYGKVVLVVCHDESIHKKQFFAHREKMLNLFTDEFSCSRIVQEYLISEAKKLEVTICDSRVDDLSLRDLLT